MKNLIITLVLCFTAAQAWAEEATLEHIKVDTDLPAIARGVDDLMGNTGYGNAMAERMSSSDKAAIA